MPAVASFFFIDRSFLSQLVTKNMCVSNRLRVTSEEDEDRWRVRKSKEQSLAKFVLVPLHAVCTLGDRTGYHFMVLWAIISRSRLIRWGMMGVVFVCNTATTIAIIRPLFFKWGAAALFSGSSRCLMDRVCLFLFQGLKVKRWGNFAWVETGTQLTV